MKVGGWWYFYLCALAVKLPLPLLITFAIALVFLIKERREFHKSPSSCGIAWRSLGNAARELSGGTTPRLGVSASDCSYAATGLKSWAEKLSWRSGTSFALLVVMGWQIGESARAQRNFLAYFNDLAGKDPSKVLSTGCDFDCGQDLYALARELHSHHVSRVTLAVWTSADVDRSGLPPYDLPTSEGKAQGWIAVSSRAFRVGDFLHQSVPPHSFDWLQNYSPIADVGKTIKLYYVDPGTTRTVN